MAPRYWRCVRSGSATCSRPSRLSGDWPAPIRRTGWFSPPRGSSPAREADRLATPSGGRARGASTGLPGRGRRGQPPRSRAPGHRLLGALQPGRAIWFEHSQVPESSGSPEWRPREHEVRRWCRLLNESGHPCHAGRPLAGGAAWHAAGPERRGDGDPPGCRQRGPPLARAPLRRRSARRGGVRTTSRGHRLPVRGAAGERGCGSSRIVRGGGAGRTDQPRGPGPHRCRGRPSRVRRHRSGAPGHRVRHSVAVVVRTHLARGVGAPSPAVRDTACSGPGARGIPMQTRPTRGCCGSASMRRCTS
jgi:hypothetical protein